MEYTTDFTQVNKYVAMADKILLGRFKEKYYLQALEELNQVVTREQWEELREKKAAGKAGADSDKNRESIEDVETDRTFVTAEEIEALRSEIQAKLNDARASMVVEKYEFACKSREYAQTSEDFGSAGQHFEEAATARKEIPVDEARLSKETRALYEETGQADEAAAVCRKKSGATYQTTRIKTVVLLLLAVVVAVGCIYGSRTTTYRKAMGKLEMSLGMYDEAVRDFGKAYDRHKSDATKALLIAAYYQQGKESYENGELEDAIEQLKEAVEADYEDAAALRSDAEMQLLAAAQIGDKVSFAGLYWKVLDIENGELTLLKFDSIAGKAFQENPEEAADWEHSSLRTYLNEEYLNAKFTSEEQSHMLQTKVTADDNVRFGTDGGSDTLDYVYILSNSEWEEYEDLINPCGHCYWLRTPGAEEGMVSFVDIEKVIMDYGYDASAETMYLKPVIRVAL